MVPIIIIVLERRFSSKMSFFARKITKKIFFHGIQESWPATFFLNEKSAVRSIRFAVRFPTKLGENNFLKVFPKPVFIAFEKLHFSTPPLPPTILENYE